MNEEKPKPKFSWSSLISFLVFLLIVAGQPIAGLVNRLIRTIGSPSGTGISVPWSTILPFAIGAVVVAGIMVVVARLIASAANGPQLPTPMSSQSLYSSPRRSDIPKTPQFDPIVSPILVVVGIVGLVGLFLLGMVVLLVAP